MMMNGDLQQEQENSSSSSSISSGYDAAELLTYLEHELGFSASEARRAVARFGGERCERALFKTRADVDGGGIRNPKGWFLSTLIRGLEWTAEDLEDHLRMQDAIRRARQASQGAADGSE